MDVAPIRDLLRADPGDADPLGRHHPRDHPGVGDKGEAQQAVAADGVRLAEMQERLFAENRRSLLLVLQGMDTSGKSGAIKHVIGQVSPLGCRIASFKRPTREELAHHFLWRIRRALPPPGHLGVFDRSHYEDVLVVRVHGLVSEAVWRRRYREINNFEKELVAAGTAVVKCLLHISYDEQRQRLLDRLEDPKKRWKFNEADIDERGRWGDYQEAYRDAVRNCSPPEAPWHVVPADRKWYRNWAVGRILLETLEEMAPACPQPDLDIPRLKARLAPPG